MRFYTVNICLKLFYFSGIHPAEGYTSMQIILYIFSLFYSSLLLFAVVFQFVDDDDDEKQFTFADISDAASCILLMTHCMAKSTPIFISKLEIMEILEFADKHFWTPKDVHSTKSKNIYTRLHNRLKNKCNLLLTFYVGTLLAFYLGPILSEGDVLIYECYRPPWMSYYSILLTMCVIGTLSTLLALIPADIFFMSLTSLAQIQFKLLNEELEDIYGKSRGASNLQEHLEIRARMNRCIRHHSIMLRFIKRINNTFSKMLLPFYVIILVTMCLEMYRVSSQMHWKRFFESMMYTTCGLYEFMFCYCLPSQALMDEAYKVGEKIYLSEWYNSHDLSKNLVLVIAMSQRDVSITAGGVVKIDVKTGLDTIKTMISYCMFLRTMASD